MFDPGNVIHRKPKRSAPVLAMAMVEPSPAINLLGKEIIFTGKLSIYASIAFMTGYMDVNCVRRFGVYVAMLTGNLIGGAIAATYDKDVKQAVLCYSMAFCTGIVGGNLSCFVLERTQCKKKAFFWLILGSCIAIVFTDVVQYLDLTFNSYAAILLAVTSGSVVHWVLKFGFSPAFMTVNSMKLAEHLYRFMFGINQGGSKLRGDLIVLLCMYSCFIFGSIMAYVVEYYLQHFSMCPLLIIPVFQVLHMHDFFNYTSGDGTTVCSRLVRTYNSIFSDPPTSAPPVIGAPVARTTTVSIGTTLNPGTVNDEMTMCDEEDDLETAASEEMTPYEREMYLAEKRASRIRNSQMTVGTDRGQTVGVYRGTMVSVQTPIRPSTAVRPTTIVKNGTSELKSPLIQNDSNNSNNL